jgi:transposase
MPACRHSLVEKAELVLICGDNYKSVNEATAIFNQRHPNNPISAPTARRILARFKSSGSLEVQYKKKHKKNVLTEINQMEVLQTVIERPQISSRQIANELEVVSKSSILRILKENKYHPYKPQFVSKLYDWDYDQRLDFSFWVQGEIEEDRNFASNILFTDESTFTTNGIVSSQNSRWWSVNNPNFVVDHRDQYYQKTNVWCGMYNGRLLGPYFFRENLNGIRYLNFLQNNVQEFLEELPLDLRVRAWYQHDGCPAHCARIVSEWLNQNLNNQWIGRFSNNKWPPRSPDMTPLDFFLWGYLKQKVYKNRPFANLDELEQEIVRCAREIPENVLRATVDEFTRRTIVCIERDGRHTETIR